jgi:hypothetical protein
MNKKAALEMSVQSIVIFIITFIVVGLLIALITGMFDQITPSVNRLMGVELDVPPPTSDKPVVIDGGKLFLTTRGTQEIIFGMYNTGAVITTGELVFRIEQCTDWTGQVGTTLLPTFQARYPVPTGGIASGEVVIFQTFVKENGMSKGDFTCTIGVHSVATGVVLPNPSIPIVSAPFLLNIK